MESESSPPHCSDDLSCGDLVTQLVGAIGRKLTAYIGGAQDIQEVDRWLAGDGINADQESRFRLALRVVNVLL